MMHYRKGENIEQELTKDELPFEDCLSKLPQKDFLWMHVKGGTKVHNVINYAKNALDKGEYRTVVWSGSGGGVVKTVSCAEILKRSYPLHQLTRMDQITIEEHWEPQLDGLEPLVAKRKLPSLHILMTLDPIDESIADVQRPNTTTEYWRGLREDSEQQKPQQQRRPGTHPEGQSQRQRYQKPKQLRQGPRQEEGADTSTGETRERPQKFKNHQNRNRGPKQQEQNENVSGQPQNEGQLQASSEQSQQQPESSGRQERQQQSQSQRRPKPKQKQQQPRPSQAANVEEASSSTTKSEANTMEPMES